MAASSRHLCRSLLRVSGRPPTKRRCQVIPRPSPQSSPFRHYQFSTTSTQFANVKDTNDDEAAGPDFQDDDLQMPTTRLTTSDLEPEERAHYETLSKPDQQKYMAIQNHIKAVMEGSEMDELSEQEAAQIARAADRSGLTEQLRFEEERNLAELRRGMWQDDEDDEFGQVPDYDDDVSPDMITSVAESELEVHREIREYTRIAAWDLPMLLQYARPFQKPDTAKTPLRFRYTTYMGESHPAQSKVVVEYAPTDLGLSEAQTTKFIKLVGVRYNPDKKQVRMACEKFENAAQNKRYLGDLVQKLIKEAKDETDTFTDIPLDFRHHKPKKIVQFPAEWMITSAKDEIGDTGVRRLVKAREEVRLLEDDKDVVDGKQTVEMYVESKLVQASPTRPAFR